MAFAKGSRVVVVDAAPIPNSKRKIPFAKGDEFVVRQLLGEGPRLSLGLRGVNGFWYARRFALAPTGEGGRG